MAEDIELTRDEIERRLEALNSPEKCAVFAGRCALRVLPYLVTGNGYIAFSEKPQEHSQAVFAAICCAFGFADAKVAREVSDCLLKATQAARDRDPDLAGKDAVEAAKNAVSAACHAVQAVWTAPLANAANAANAYYHAIKAEIYGVKAKAYAEAKNKATVEWDKALAKNQSSDIEPEAEAKKAADAADPTDKIDQLKQFIEFDLQQIEEGEDLRYSRDAYLVRLFSRGNFYPVISKHDTELCELLSNLVEGQPNEQGIKAWLVNWYDKFKRTDAFAIDDKSKFTAESIAEKDSLNRGAITRALFRLLTERENSQHFAIGLFGQWGAGKTSLLNLLQKQIKESAEHKDRFIIAEFNAWKNEKASNLGAMLAQAVVDGLTKDLSFPAKFRLAVNLALCEKNALGANWQWLLVRLKLYGGIVLSGLLLYGVWEGINSLNDYVEIKNILTNPTIKLLIQGGMATSMLYLLYTTVAKFLSARLNRLFLANKSLPDYSEHCGLLGEIQKTLSNLCDFRLGEKYFAGLLGEFEKPLEDFCKSDFEKKCREGEKHLLLIVDDLDRCSVNAVKEVLDAVRLVADIPRVTTIVAIDERMAFAAVEKHYDQFGHAGRAPALVAREYLAKILQASISLPDKEEVEVIKTFVTEQLFKKAKKEVSNDQAPKGKLKAENSTSPISTPAVIPNKGQIDSDNEEETSDIANQPVENNQTKPSETPESSPVMPEPLETEIELFHQLTHIYEFGNPRLMGHMYLAWRLIKGILLEQKKLGTPGTDGEMAYQHNDIEHGLRWLFWREFCLQQEHKTRESMEKWLGQFAKGEWPEPDQTHKYQIGKITFPNDFIPLLWDMSRDEAWKERLPIINTVLLPAPPKMAAKEEKK